MTPERLTRRPRCRRAARRGRRAGPDARRTSRPGSTTCSPSWSPSAHGADAAGAGGRDGRPLAGAAGAGRGCCSPRPRWSSAATPSATSRSQGTLSGVGRLDGGRQRVGAGRPSPPTRSDRRRRRRRARSRVRPRRTQRDGRRRPATRRRGARYSSTGATVRIRSEPARRRRTPRPARARRARVLAELDARPTAAPGADRAVPARRGAATADVVQVRYDRGRAVLVDARRSTAGWSRSRCYSCSGRASWPTDRRRGRRATGDR